MNHESQPSVDVEGSAAEDGGLEGAAFDPLCLERATPMDDEEAALVEAICQAATPGPLVLEDEAEGDSEVVALLPDGRRIVSLTVSTDRSPEEGVGYANVQLICKARHLLLRLLQDRRQWNEQREFLMERIHTLETALRNDRDEAGESPAPAPKVLVGNPR